MATLPFFGPAAKHRQPLTGSRRIIVSVAIGFAVFLIWAMLAQVDEVTAGQGKVIPSSKVLIDKMLSRVDWENTKLFVEYGPGWARSLVRSSTCCRATRPS